MDNNSSSKHGRLHSSSSTFTAIKAKTMFSTSSSSSTSSISSCTYNLNMMSGEQQGFNTPINPFEETNKFRLEQSVLSPNLFHVANTSTPERDTNSLWNIDQRAVLYPADIPTDESSLIAQYIYDSKLNKQVSAAVEAFWTQNKVIIESPAASTTGSALRAKFGINPHHHHHHSSASSNNGYGSSGGGSGTAKKNAHKSSSYKAGSFSVNSPLSIDLKSNFANGNSGTKFMGHSTANDNTGESSSVGGKTIHSLNKNQHQSYKVFKKDQGILFLFE
jgi:hypothetical protein